MKQTLDIYFRDFTPEAQARILQAVGLADLQETNWDTLPVCALEFEEKKEAEA